MDQARTLRRMANQPGQRARRSAASSGRRPLRVIAVTSGKGGVGKTTVVANIGYELGTRGYRVLLLDGDLGLANLNIVLGLSPQYNLQHVLEGERSIDEILLNGPGNMVLLPSSSGVLEMTRLSMPQRMKLLEEMEVLEDRFDVLLVDTGAGISENVLFLARASQEVVVVLTPEPTSMTDAYATIKVLNQHHKVTDFRILVNMVQSAAEARQVYRKLSSVVATFLNASLDLLGHIQQDKAAGKAILNRRLLMQDAPRSVAARGLATIAERLARETSRRPPTGSLGFFWQRLLRDAQGGEHVA